MTIPSIRTTTHIYPQSELDAMRDFYHGKRCVITLVLEGVEWSHTLDAALEPGNHRVSQSLILLILCDDAEDVLISFHKCLRANCVRIDIPDMPLKCRKISCHVHPYFFSNRLISD